MKGLVWPIWRGLVREFSRSVKSRLEADRAEMELARNTALVGVSDWQAGVQVVAPVTLLANALGSSITTEELALELISLLSLTVNV